MFEKKCLDNFPDKRGVILAMNAGMASLSAAIDSQWSQD